MKKPLYACAALALCLLPYLSAMAESGQVAGFDWTWIIVAVITTAVWLFSRYVLPLMSKHKWLGTLAEIACQIAEALFGRGSGQKKWEWALWLLEKIGLNVDSEKVIAALQAAWESLNQKQIEMGLKREDASVGFAPVCIPLDENGEPLPMEAWSDDELRLFLTDNGMDASQCSTREEMMDLLDIATLAEEEITAEDTVEIPDQKNLFQS